MEPLTLEEVIQTRVCVEQKTCSVKWLTLHTKSHVSEARESLDDFAQLKRDHVHVLVVIFGTFNEKRKIVVVDESKADEVMAKLGATEYYIYSVSPKLENDKPEALKQNLAIADALKLKKTVKENLKNNETLPVDSSKTYVRNEFIQRGAVIPLPKAIRKEPSTAKKKKTVKKTGKKPAFGSKTKQKKNVFSKIKTKIQKKETKKENKETKETTKKTNTVNIKNKTSEEKSKKTSKPEPPSSTSTTDTSNETDNVITKNLTTIKKPVEKKTTKKKTKNSLASLWGKAKSKKKKTTTKKEAPKKKQTMLTFGKKTGDKQPKKTTKPSSKTKITSTTKPETAKTTKSTKKPKAKPVPKPKPVVQAPPKRKKIQVTYEDESDSEEEPEKEITDRGVFCSSDEDSDEVDQAVSRKRKRGIVESDESEPEDAPPKKLTKREEKRLAKKQEIEKKKQRAQKIFGRKKDSSGSSQVSSQQSKKKVKTKLIMVMNEDGFGEMKEIIVSDNESSEVKSDEASKGETKPKTPAKETPKKKPAVVKKTKPVFGSRAKKKTKQASLSSFFKKK